MNIHELKTKINKALDILYENDIFLIKEGLGERCINHRFAIYLEEQDFGEGYFVDCEYDKSHGNGETNLKKISSERGNSIDIIITKRDKNPDNDLVCFEVKKWSNIDLDGIKKDRKNLKILTGGEISSGNSFFCYDYGVYIIFGESREHSIIEIYKDGELQKVSIE